MFQVLRGPLTVVGRLLLCTIFFMAAVGNKIPHFSDVAKVMESVGIPAPQFLLDDRFRSSPPVGCATACTVAADT